ncbi:hypothetical protein KVT40_001685 [Elsinoe batatas]|uniref:S1/P1 nuclease n=1 Tax=Elsinoe batatas TaxID=2601811 RepID=A0A8K0L960_9PEZI|nr:hypothetical protein KVT40_001685 [Elsinoe batatas]
MRSTTSLLLLSALPSAFSWGRLGHDAVAFIAQTTSPPAPSVGPRPSSATPRTNTSPTSPPGPTPTATSLAASSPPPSTTSPPTTPLPPAATSTSNATAGPDGCVVSAIANYTRRVRERRLDAQQRDFALRFLVHFLGDIHQPLHNEVYEAGANGVIITFNNATRNLDATWDTQIPERLRGSYSRPAARLWADYLIARIDQGVYTRDVRSWKRGLNVNDGAGSALRWSNEANEYVCGYVAPKGWDALTGDLATNGYYDRAVPTVELQVARAGVRLAAWLDGLSREGKRDYEVAEVDLSGRDLLPESREYTPAPLRRREEGYGCGCGEHEH